MTGLALGIRHGIDWDHIAAITDITSTTAAAGVAEAAHEEQHRSVSGDHHGHGGALEMHAHDAGPGAATLAPATARRPELDPDGSAAIRPRRSSSGRCMPSVTAWSSSRSASPRCRSGRSCPTGSTRSWAAIVGVTLVALGLWVLYSVYRYARGGETFRLRSRWMLVFDGVRYAWRRFGARLHGHEHVEPLEMSSYGPKTSFGVGMIHGIGAETGTQVLLIAAVGGAASAGLGIPMLFAFVLGLLISNFAIVLLTSVGFVASQTRERIYVVGRPRRGLFSLILGTIYCPGTGCDRPGDGLAAALLRQRSAGADAAD